MEKLTDLGWGYEIEQLCWHNDLGRHALVKQPTRLSDRSESSVLIVLLTREAYVLSHAQSGKILKLLSFGIWKI